MRIGIAFDLKANAAGDSSRPDDALEEYDAPETIAGLAGTLRDLGHETVELGGGRGFLDEMVSNQRADTVDLVFNMAEGQGSRSREAHVPAVCEMLGVAYTHSDPMTLAVTLDKELTKRIAVSHGIATPQFCLIERLDDLREAPIPRFPVIAKPNQEGSSMGIRRDALCHDRAALEAALAAAKGDPGIAIHEAQPSLEDVFIYLQDPRAKPPQPPSP